MSKIDLGNKKYIEFGMLGTNSRTVHFFRFKSIQQPDSELVPDIEDMNNLSSYQKEEESKIGMFFKKFSEKVLPASLTHEKSCLRIYMEKSVTQDLPYLIFPSNNSTLIVSIS
jgi:hypothetical protein